MILHPRQRLFGFAAVVAFFAVWSYGCSTGEPADPGPTGTQAEIDRYYENRFLRDFTTPVDAGPRFGDLDPKTKAALRDRGEYLVNGAAACASCHSENLGGGMVLQDRFGAVRAANITPSGSGISGWDIRDIIRALRASLTPESTPLSIDLHATYRWMSDADAKAIAVYLLSTQPVENQVERRALGVFERKRWGLFSRHREVEGYVPSPPRSTSAPYGRYLAYHVSGCYGCHTPAGGLIDDAPPFSGHNDVDHGIVASFGELLTALVPKTEETVKQESQGSLKLLSHDAQEKYLGAPVEAAAPAPSVLQDRSRGIGATEKYDAAVESGAIPVTGPDIRGTSEKGLAGWSKKDIVRYLATGMTPRGELKDGRVCPWPQFKRMSEGDREAVANFLKNQ